MDHIELHVHQDRFRTHIVDLVCAVLIGLVLGGISVYAWSSSQRGIHFEYDSISPNSPHPTPAQKMINEIVI